MSFKRSAMEVFEEALIAGDPSEAIMNQERRGPHDLVNSTALPIKFNSGTREQLESFGIIYGEPIDDLFVNVQLPDGWEKEGTDHSMGLQLLDEHGRVRASIFYKAAFYDRDAFISVKRRFHYSTQPVGGWEKEVKGESRWSCVVHEGDKPIWESETIGPQVEPGNQERSVWYAEKDRVGEQAEQWLDDNYPDWRDPSKYWDEGS